MIATKQKANPVNGKVAVSPKGKTVRKSKKGKRYNVKPTAKQKKVIEILVENPRKTGGQVLKEAWYSEASQIKPSEVLNSRAIQDFFAKDGSGIDALKKKHNELLNSADIRRISMPMQLEDEEIIAFFHDEFPWSKVLRIILEDDKKAYRPEKIVVLRVPDSKLQREALDMAYKVLWLYKDPSAWNPPPATSPDEQSIRVSKAKQIFQLWTQPSQNKPSSQTTSSK